MHNLGHVCLPTLFERRQSDYKGLDFWGNPLAGSIKDDTFGPTSLTPRKLEETIVAL